MMRALTLLSSQLDFGCVGISCFQVFSRRCQLPLDNVREHQCVFCKNLSLFLGTVVCLKEAYGGDRFFG